ncbi:DUF5712 family protein [Mucilaginibacter sp. UYCu711]|uniref:DUF5712 family protein n=1 Tax=Mucilaginibacter sp. UYCu711 TaxID=3156339 RepID=UPI003D20CF47
MHSKIITPKNNSNNAIYSNNGSSIRAVNYLGKEEKANDKVFFSDDKITSYDKQFVVEAIDSNVKGLKAIDDKFDSIIISPSLQELAHIGDDPQKLKEYCRDVMRNYSNNFDLSEKKKVSEKPVSFLSSGHAPYLNDPENKGSFYITFKQDNGKEKTIWGIDLERAVVDSNVKSGDQIFIENLGKEKVIVPVESYIDGNKVTTDKEVTKNNWKILFPDEMASNDAKKAALKKPTPTAEPLWFATIHHTREYNATDAKKSKVIVDLKEQGLTLKEIIELKNKELFLKTINPSVAEIETFYKNGAVKAGDNKPGDQRHLHIIVSRRDKQMRHTLNPNSYGRFNRNGFVTDNINRFANKFNYQGNSMFIDEARVRSFTRRIEHLNKKFKLAPDYLSEGKIIKAFKDSPNKDEFSKRFNKIEWKIKKGELPPDPMKFLVPDAEQSREKFKKANHSFTVESILSTIKGVSNELDESKDYVLPVNQMKKRLKKNRQQREADHDQSR